MILNVDARTHTHTYTHTEQMTKFGSVCDRPFNNYCNYLLFHIITGVPLSEWVAANTDLRSHVLVLQQVVNTLVVIFQGEENLSFWGSYEG